MQERPVVQNRSARGWCVEGVGAMYFWPFCENARTAFVKCEVQGTVVRRGVAAEIKELDLKIVHLGIT